MASNPQIDLATLTTLIKLVTPAAVAPVLPLATVGDFSKSSEGAFGMAKDIQYLTKTVDNIERKMDKITETHVTTEAANAHILDDNKIHAEQKEILNDHETRMRSTEKTQTRILTWGSILIFATTLAQLVLRMTGH